MIKFFISFSLLFLSLSLIGQTSHKLLRSGDKNYQSQDYASAEESYRKSLEKEKSLKGKYNLGNTVYNQDRHEEAIRYYEDATSLARNDGEKSDAFYNLGNAQFKNQQLEESIESYKQSLRLDPSDADARKNLFLAKMAKLQQQQQEQEQQQNDQEENNENQDQQEQEDQQENQQQQENQDQPQQQGEENPIEDNPKEEQSQQEQKLSKEDAERLLQIIENEEKKVQEKLKKVTGKRKKPEKDW